MKTPKEININNIEENNNGSTLEDNTDFYGFNEEENIINANIHEENLLINIEFKQISIGYKFSCGIRYDNGNLLCWGFIDGLLYGSSKNEYLTIDGPFKQVSAGTLGVCAIYEDGIKPILCLGPAKSIMSNYHIEFDQISVRTTMICGVNMDNSQLECSNMNKNIAAATPPNLEIA